LSEETVAVGAGFHCDKIVQQVVHLHNDRSGKNPAVPEKEPDVT